MSAARILREVCVAETREVAFDPSGRPFAARLERLTEARVAQLGQAVSGRLRTISLAQGGGFIELDDHQGDAFLRLKEGHGITEGTRLDLRVVAEPREGNKLARVALASEATELPTSKPWGAFAVEEVAPGDPDVAAVFDSIIAKSVTLPGGGSLSLERTRALVAADIDTSGRTETGRAASRALKVNLDAAAELARQIRLRNLGGLVVLDCVAPINRDAGQQIKTRFETMFRSISDSQCRALAPTELGLLQASVAWGETPLTERLLETNGDMSASSVCYEGFRLLEQEARIQSMARLQLGLPAHAFAWLSASGVDLKRKLAGKYGDRFSYESTNTPAPTVSKIT